MIPAIKVFVVTLVALGSTLVVSPSHMQPVLGVKPVSVQHFSQLTEPNDVQPALGVNAVQKTADPQPNVGVVGDFQATNTTNFYQRTFDPQQ